MSRLVNTDGVGRQRDRLMKAVMLALKTLASRKEVNDEVRDLVAFMALALNEIHETIDVTCQAWEKRDYWLKADQFRREWAWAGRMGDKLERVVLGEQWQDLPARMVDLSKHLEKVSLPKRNTLGTPWVGALTKLKKEREFEDEM